MTIFMIGGTGFISGAIVRRLVAAGHRVTLFTRGRRPLPADIAARVEVCTGDRRKANILAESLGSRTFDAVIDMVAYRPEESAAAASLFRGRTGRFIHCSTTSVYMVSHQVRCPITEDQADRPLMDFWPRNPFGMDYGLAKRECEDVLWKAHDERLFPVTMLRPTFVSGPEDPTRRDWFWIERIRDGGPLVVPGSGDHAFQQVYVGDAAQAFLAALEETRAVGNAYNVAGPEIFSLNEYLSALGALMGRAPALVHVPQEVFDGLSLSYNMRGDVFPFNTRRTAVFSLDRVRQDLGYRPTPFDDWMRTTIEWWTAAGRASSLAYDRRDEERALAAQWDRPRTAST